MLQINRLKMSLRERQELEQAIAREAQNAADIEYIAMMADIDLDEGENEYDAQQEV